MSPESRERERARQRSRRAADREAAKIGDEAAQARIAAQRAANNRWQKKTGGALRRKWESDTRDGARGEDARLALLERQKLAARKARLKRRLAKGATTKKREEARQMRTRLLDVPIYAAIAGAVPRGYPPHVRDDVISATVVRLLEDPSLDPREEARRQATAYWNSRTEYRMDSMDAAIFAEGRTTRHDRISTSDLRI